MDPVAELEPRAVWAYFAALSVIPRPSRHEQAAADWVADTGRALGLSVERDAVGNVLLRKPASPGKEGAPTVAMQAHVDMVCEKNEDVIHDFTRDPIRLRREGDLLRATGTTLGADDGIGVAGGLALLADPTLVHGPLELLVTIDEETGLTGANELAGGWLRARYLLNLDSEEEGTVTIGCAGGVDSIATRRPSWEPAPAGTVALRVKVHGCKGGHSGGDIHLGRANAIRVLAQVLDQAGSARLTAFNGGNKRNAIPREAWALVAVPAGEVEAYIARIRAAEAHWRGAFAAFDPGLSIAVDPAPTSRVLGGGDGRALLSLLLALPHGVEAMSPAIPNLVQTSTNLGVVHTTDEQLEINLLTRSAIEASKESLARRIDAACRLAGFEVERVGGYPGWKPEPGARLVQVLDDVWQAQGGKPMHVMAIHAGLECGLIGEKYPGMEMASFGPDVRDAHTPDEYVNIPSVARFYALLRSTVERLAT
jgi:dipeptidase D